MRIQSYDFPHTVQNCIELNLLAMEKQTYVSVVGKCCFITTKSVLNCALAQPTAPSPALQEALDKGVTEGTQDPEERRVHLNRVDETQRIF